MSDALFDIAEDAAGSLPSPWIMPVDDERDITANRHGGDELSTAAHESVKSAKALQREEIVRHVRERGNAGATCEETAQALGLRMQTCSARFSDLRAARILVESGERRPTSSGRSARVHVVAGDAV